MGVIRLFRLGCDLIFSFVPVIVFSGVITKNKVGIIHNV